MGIDLIPYYPVFVPWFLNPAYPLPWSLALIYSTLVAVLTGLGAVLVARELVRTQAGSNPREVEHT